MWQGPAFQQGDRVQPEWVGGHLGWIVWTYGKTNRGYCSTNWYRGDRRERMPTDKTADQDQDADRDTPIMSCLRVQVECEYWAEMARLAHERESA